MAITRKNGADAKLPARTTTKAQTPEETAKAVKSKKISEKQSCFWKTFPTAVGECAILWRGDKIVSIFLPEKSAAGLQKRCSQTSAQKNADNQLLPGIAEAIVQIQNYFAGEEFSFKKIKLDITGVTPFKMAIYEELRKIEPGCLVSYSQLAERCGNKSASRAVGSAVGANPCPPVIPCHRVINTDGRLGGFSAAGGCALKAKMLRLEGVNVSDMPPLRILPPPTFSDIQIEAAIRHLCHVDPDLGRFILSAPTFNLKGDNLSSPFMALLEAIVYQQLTGKAAATIFGRVLGLFASDGKITPLDIIRAEDDELRSAGLSGPKIAAIRDLAEFAASGKLPDLDTLHRMTDHQIISTLTKIRGIGRWTVEMLLIFRLGRTDVMAADDYGLRKGLAQIRGTPGILPEPQELSRQARKWQPFRSIAAWYLWRASESAARPKL